MTHHTNLSATIERPIHDVFDWVTTPGYVPQYSPLTLGIDAPEPWRPLRAGERFTEQVRILSWRGHIEWTAEVIERPYRCVLTGNATGDKFLDKLLGHHHARIEYTLQGDERTTLLTRDASYSEGLIGRIGDDLGFGLEVDDAAKTALQTMVSMLENPLLHGPKADSTSESLAHIADPLADEAVASLVSPSGDCSALDRFLAILYRGDPPPGDLPEPLQRFFEATASPPAWACKPRLDAASKVFLDWNVLGIGAHVCGSLPETYVIPRIAKLLNLTRQLDRDPKSVDRRLWFTVRMCIDVLVENGLEPGGRGMLALQRLRLIHATIRLFLQRRMETPRRLAHLPSDALWDTPQGQPISQIELLHTMLTFSYVIVRAMDIWQADLTPYERESYIHIWNVAGAVLGIDPRILPRDAADAQRIFETIKAREAAPTPEAIQLGRALVWFWTSLLPVTTHADAKKLMQFCLSTQLSQETIRINGLDDLPEFSPAEFERIKRVLADCDCALSNEYEDAPFMKQVVALFVTPISKCLTARFEDKSGMWNIPESLYRRWAVTP